MLKISPLFSGSKGNCTLIQSDNTNILLDAGFSYRGILRALQSHQLSPQDIDGIIVSHEHTDHISALPLWTRSTATPIYAPEEIGDYLRQRVYFSEVKEIGTRFTVGDIAVETYECSHDAHCCFGFRFSVGNTRFACVTDTGCATDLLIDFLSPCQAVMLESNHDVDMLIRGEYSYPLKKRILSDFGHLSNVQCCEILRKIAPLGVKNIILAHLSEKNNTKELAFNAVVNACNSVGLTEGKDIQVFVADQYKNEVTICID